MKLLSPDTGWVSDGNKLFWTNDGGDNWTQITPRPPGLKFAVPGLQLTGASLSIVFFRDTSEGWVIVSYPEQMVNPQVQDNSKMAYTMAHTVDSGITWSFTPLTYPELPQQMQDSFVGPRDLYFVDSLHGWLDIAFEGNSKTGKAACDGGWRENLGLG